MRCLECGYQNPKGSLFCSKCGSKFGDMEGPKFKSEDDLKKRKVAKGGDFLCFGDEPDTTPRKAATWGLILIIVSILILLATYAPQALDAILENAFPAIIGLIILAAGVTLIVQAYIKSSES